VVYIHANTNITYCYHCWLFTLTANISVHSGEVKAVCIYTGHIAWSIDLQCRMESSVTASSDCSIVYIGGHNGYMHALAVTSGAVLWSFDTHDVIKCTPTATVISQQPALLVGSHSCVLYCLKQVYGTCIWQLQCNGQVFSSPVHDTVNGIVYVATTSGSSVIAVVDSTGVQLWQYSTTAPVFADLALTAYTSTTTARTDKGATTIGAIAVCNKELTCVIVAAVDGSITLLSTEAAAAVAVWRIVTQAIVFSSPCVCTLQQQQQHQGMFVIGDQSGYVSCYIVSGGTLVWRTQIVPNDTEGASVVYASPFLLTYRAIALVAAATSSGSIVLLDLYTGVLISTIQAPGQTFSSPVVVDDRLYIGCRSDALLCYQLYTDKC
jgi:acyl-CoA synthetase